MREVPYFVTEKIPEYSGRIASPNPNSGIGEDVGLETAE